MATFHVQRFVKQCGPASMRQWCRLMSSGDALKGKVAFVGLGNMGSQMARNLQEKGCDLVLYDKWPDNPNIKNLVAKGAKSFTSVEEMCQENITAVVSMVIAPADVRNLYCSPETGFLKHLKTKPLMLDCSTIDPQTAKEVAEQVAAAGHKMVDAPVGGGVPAASAGTLTFMVGAPSKEDFEAALPILDKMGTNIHHCGAPSSGQAAKICNNLILAASMLATAEGFRLGDKLGVDPTTLYHIINGSSGQCWSSQTYCPVPDVREGTPACRDYEPPSYQSHLMKKDLELALKTGDMCGLKMPVSQFSDAMFRHVLDAGHGRLDIGCVYKYMPDKP